MEPEFNNDNTKSAIGKKMMLYKIVCFQIVIKGFNYVTSEGAISHNVLYNQQLFVAHYQVRFYATHVE